MEFFDNHKKLFGVATLLFSVLTLFVAIFPAISNQRYIKPLPDAPTLTEAAARGKALYISNGCVACHSQQVRNIEMDKSWGTRASLAADYAGNTRTDFWRNTATLMGTARIGPDLTDIGNRQPSLEWNLVHLFNPRIVVPESIMPAYPWLFKITKEVTETDFVVNIPDEGLISNTQKVVATQDALDLVAYLQSLKQTPLPDGTALPKFLLEKTETNDAAVKTSTAEGKALYVAHCQACHQANGKGLPGAFPPLKGSGVVTGQNLTLYVDIIMNGYDARPEYGAMSAIGANLGWTEKEVAAIINYERTSWGNAAPEVTTTEIKKILDFLKDKTKQQ
ncbi:cytochrome c [Sphingobacterium psychroaquaticum]|uniref:Cytochrome c oxidase cbb3-type subunit 2 n=1 Tax=Sphingobacterium psychroaquaticum TaxID=561061 RepID=A0A1X7IYW7_9SPHI|nr:cbb3-type cytochrome c oxidase subunit II [Sphingobacterium psychroaquaticum]QBQ40308.1 c-type cytochrome [Sphingobacterium psychroaquaticum]SMG20059.1 cytochrome c oxidase cbb3-type subunit 2 [Sphingobacterium psychroaquaticum]